MELKIAYIKSEQLALIKSFNFTSQLKQKALNPDPFTSLSLNQLREEGCHLILLSDHLPMDEFNSYCVEESKFCPVSMASKIGIHSEDQFTQLSEGELKQIVQSQYSKWILANNLQTLEELFPLIQHLKGLFQKDYTHFYEELWFTLKRNLGATSLRVIFHDIHNMEQEKLDYSFIDGGRFPRLQPGSEIEKKLMKMYPHSFQKSLSLISLNDEKGELVATAQLNKIPFLIMGQVPLTNKLQLTLMSTLFEGLQAPTK